MPIPTLIDFLKSTPPDLLMQYFERTAIPLSPKPAWNGKAADLATSLHRLVERLEDEPRLRVMNDSDRIGAMADDSGQNAIFAVTPNGEALAALTNGYARAVWMLLNEPLAFDFAEQVRYADDRRYGRMWDGFVCEKNSDLARDGEPLAAFVQSLREHFSCRNVEVEICDRLRFSINGENVALIQVTIYREGRSGERKAFVNGRVDRLPDHPVIEAAIIYDQATGTTEVVAAVRETRVDLVKLFSRSLLGCSFEGERLPIRQYTLDHLRRVFEFPTDPEDHVQEVKVSLLRLMPLDTGGERITLECMRGSSRTIWAMATARFGSENPLHSGFRITQVRFVVRFRSELGGRAKALPVTISMPQGCDLKDRTARELLIGDKYLRRWGFVRDVG